MKTWLKVLLWVLLLLVIVGAIITAAVLNSPTRTCSSTSDKCPSSGDTIKGAFTCDPGVLMTSTDGRSTVTLENAGHLVVKRDNTEVWRSTTTDVASPQAVFNGNGLLSVVSGTNSQPVNRIATDNCPASMTLDNNAIWRILNSQGDVIWTAIPQRTAT